MEDQNQQWHRIVLGVATLMAVVHQCVFWDWYIEDAAISFAYARNLASGEGLVPFAGGERVEGYSNPTWTFFLAIFHFLGVDLFKRVQVITLGLAVATVPVVYAVAREMAPTSRTVPAFAVAFLAFNTQFALWGGSGLENGLLNLLLALAVWRSLLEWRGELTPWSSLIWLAVALTRPEAIAYAAIGGFASMIATRSVSRTAQWLGLFFVPFFAYHAVRYQYFAYVFPNTYYAKLGHASASTYERLVGWDGVSWAYVGDWALQYGHAALLPLYVLGLAHQRTRAVVAFALPVGLLWIADVVEGQQHLPTFVGVACTVGVMAWVRHKDLPANWSLAALVVGSLGCLNWELSLVNGAEATRWVEVAPFFLPGAGFMALAVAAPLLAWGEETFERLALLWWLHAAAVLFALYAFGDWMQGFRWLSAASVPGCLLMALGLDVVRRRLEEAVHGSGGGVAVVWALTGLVVVGFGAINATHSLELAARPDTSPLNVKLRADYSALARATVHHEGPWRQLEVDQGAHLWFTDFEMIDYGGLVDVPIAQHKHPPTFLREYIFEEKKPHFAHMHGHWAERTKIPAFSEWERDYIEIPGYRAGSGIHDGIFVRRELVMASAWPHGSERRFEFEEGLTLEGVEVVQPAVAGDTLTLEVGASIHNEAAADLLEGVRMIARIRTDSTKIKTWDTPLGYGWLGPEKWSKDEVFVGRFTLEVPEDVDPGFYHLSVLIFRSDGSPLGVALPRGEARARGVGSEVRFKNAVKVLAPAEGDALRMDQKHKAMELADAGKCDAARKTFLPATWRDHEEWLAVHGPAVDGAVASCYAGLAELAQDRGEQLRLLEKAREVDHHNADLARVGGPIAAERFAEGVAAQKQKAWDEAYEAFTDVLAIDRSYSWARRYAEEARAHRFNLPR